MHSLQLLRQHRLTRCLCQKLWVQLPSPFLCEVQARPGLSDRERMPVLRRFSVPAQGRLKRYPRRPLNMHGSPKLVRCVLTLITHLTNFGDPCIFILNDQREHASYKFWREHCFRIYEDLNTQEHNKPSSSIRSSMSIWLFFSLARLLVAICSFVHAIADLRHITTYCQPVFAANHPVVSKVTSTRVNHLFRRSLDQCRIAPFLGASSIATVFELQVDDS